MKTALVTGSSGFIGGHLVRRLQKEGYYVIGADIEEPKYSVPDRFYHYDLRVQNLCKHIFIPNKLTEQYEKIDDVYNLACLMGGMGYIGRPEFSYDVMIGSTEIVSNILDCCITYGVKKVFYSSSACVYNQFKQDDLNNPGLKESDAYPAWPDLIYGWQKLCSEKMHESAYLSHGLDIRIARFHNIYGPEGTYTGGKEKAPAAICRKVIEKDPAIWGDGKQTRSFLYIDDCINAVRLLMNSDYKDPINIGSEEMVSINQLAILARDIAKSDLPISHIDGPTGVRGRNSNNELIRKILGWEPKFSLKDGLTLTYNWIKSQYILSKGG